MFVFNFEFFSKFSFFFNSLNFQGYARIRNFTTLFSERPQDFKLSQLLDFYRKPDETEITFDPNDDMRYTTGARAHTLTTSKENYPKISIISTKIVPKKSKLSQKIKILPKLSPKIEFLAKFGAKNRNYR